MSDSHADPYFNQIQDRAVQNFEARGRIKSFQEYFGSFLENPARHLRTSSRYLLEAIRFFGYEEVDLVGMKGRRWRVFDLDYDPERDSLVGQERVQEAIYRQVLQFAKRGDTDKMILLHGPNGSSKTTIVESLFRGLEHFSLQPEGAVYGFNWVFTEREDRMAERIGFEHDLDAEPPDSYAHLKSHEIAVRIPCELRCPPLFLIPKEERGRVIEDAVKSHGDPEQFSELNYSHFMNGDLCTKCRKIYDALLISNRGSWRDVVRHVQVERWFFSQRYRRGAISIEPQGNIDADSRPLTYETPVQLPPILQNLGLTEMVGDLIDANRGVLEYSDFLKRPLETNKYLLTTSEKGTIQLRNQTAHLDLTIFATANEKQLSLFKRNPDFPSFKGRMELVPVPYLLMVSKEMELYQRHLDLFSRGRHLTPHTARMAALWAVLSRLRRPSAKNYAPELAPIVARLSPVEKARLYDEGEPPIQFKDEERKLLKANIRTIREELNDAEGEFEGMYGAEYEGRRGASPREMLSLLASAAENRAYECLTPMAVFDELTKLTKDSSLYEFLRVQVDNGYNDCVRFIDDVKSEYSELVTQEVFDRIGLVDEEEYERVFEEYFHHVKAFDLGERLYVPARNEYVSPSQDLLGRIEGLLSITEPIASFRSNLMTQIAAFSIENPDTPINYQTLFPQIYATFKQSFYSERDRALTAIEQNMLKPGTDDFEQLTAEDQELVREALGRMKEKYGYCDACAKDVIAFVLRSR